jgi:hypothetical protein
VANADGNALYEGDDCSKKTCPAGCGEHGKCAEGACVCEAGWKGKMCDIKMCKKGLNGLECSGKGECIFGKCVCKQGFIGEACAAEPKKKLVMTSQELQGCSIKCTDECAKHVEDQEKYDTCNSDCLERCQKEISEKHETEVTGSATAVAEEIQQAIQPESASGPTGAAAPRETAEEKKEAAEADGAPSTGATGAATGTKKQSSKATEGESSEEKATDELRDALAKASVEESSIQKAAVADEQETVDSVSSSTGSAGESQPQNDPDQDLVCGKCVDAFKEVQNSAASSGKAAGELPALMKAHCESVQKGQGDRCDRVKTAFQGSTFGDVKALRNACVEMGSCI